MKLIIGGSLFFSILQSILLWNKAPGISVVLFVVPLILYFVFFLNKNGKIINKKGLVWSIPIIALSFTYFIFNNELFQFLNAVAICMLWLIMCISVTKTDLKLKELITNMFSLIAGAFEHIETAMRGIKDVIKQEDGEKSKKSRTLIKALIITVPVAIVVVFLLASADSIFSNLFSGIGDALDKLIGNESIPETLARIILIIMIFAYMAGFMHNIAGRKTEENIGEVDKKRKNLDAVTIGMMFIILDIVYLIFCAIQVVYLFTKAGMPNGMTYADYARQGFFQLMIVTFINFAILLWVYTKKSDNLNKFQTNFIKSMEVLMEICTQIIIVSAFYRMFLYEQAYGYTYSRLFVYFILSVEFIFMMFVIAYTLGKKINLVKWGLIIGTTAYMVLNYINVDVVIAKNNIDRYFANPEEEFDFYYLESHTGTDAIAEIKRLLDTNDEALARSVKFYLLHEQTNLKNDETWLEFNISRVKARNNLKGIKVEVDNNESDREKQFVISY